MLLRREGGVLKKRGRVLKKRRLVRGAGGGPLLQKGGGGWLLKEGGGGVLKNPVEVLKEFDPLPSTLSVSPHPSKFAHNLAIVTHASFR